MKYRIESGKKFSIVTPNPEIVLASSGDPQLKKSLNKADLALPDGVGLALAGRFLGLPLPLNILPGRKVFLALVSLANQNSWRVFLLGGESGVAGGAAAKLVKIRTMSVAKKPKPTTSPPVPGSILAGGKMDESIRKL